MKEEIKVKRKLSIKGLIFILLVIYLIIMGAFAIYKMPIKNIIINGNNLITDKEIMDAANIKVNDSLWKVNSWGMKKNITALNLISDVKIKRNLLGKVTINVTEERILFYYVNDKKYVLGNGDEISIDHDLKGVPTLINYVASDILKLFEKALGKIDSAVLETISEIEYDPDIENNITIDDGRFLLKMNDENSVYINIVNLEKLNNYKKYLATLSDNAKGIMYLDSNFDGAMFKTYDKIMEEKEKAKEEKEDKEKKKEENKDELSE